MKKLLGILSVLFLLLAFTGCSSETGSVTVNLVDAPIDDASVEGVFITVTGLAYGTNNSENEWVEVSGFEGPETYNLLDLTNGNYEMLGEFILPAGKITQLRFFIDAPETGDNAPSNPGCYVKLFNDDEHYPLFVPSGSESGFKATGQFDVPVNGTVTITADFDVRKSVREVNLGTSPSYNLQPTIKLLVEDNAGAINGSVDYTGTNSLVVFAYEDGTYEATEAAEPVSEADDPQFYNSVSSCLVEDLDGDDSLEYKLPFLAVGVYDLVVVEVDLEGNYLTGTINIIEDVEVESKGTAVEDIVFLFD